MAPDPVDRTLVSSGGIHPPACNRMPYLSASENTPKERGRRARYTETGLVFYWRLFTFRTMRRSGIDYMHERAAAIESEYRRGKSTHCRR